MNRRTVGEQPFTLGDAVAQGVGFGPALSLIALVALSACSTPPRTAPPTERATLSAESESGQTLFSGQRVLENLSMLVDAGSRRPGSLSAARAADWIVDELQAMGAEVEVWGSGPAGSDLSDASIGALVGILEGESPDPVLLVARYDTLPGERDKRGPKTLASATGAAVVLELGRVLAQVSRPYSIWLVFIEGDGLAGGPEPPQASSQSSEALIFPGSHAAAAELEARQLIERVRLAIFLGSLPGPKFVLERDLRSHRMYRETFWQSAELLDGTSMFPATNTFSSPQAGHLAFLARGVRPTVALIGRYDEVLGGGAGSPEMRESLPDAAEFERLGRVTLDALDRISRRLGRIEAFANSPLGKVPAADAMDSPPVEDETSEKLPDSSKSALD